MMEWQSSQRIRNSVSPTLFDGLSWHREDRIAPRHVPMDCVARCHARLATASRCTITALFLHDRRQSLSVVDRTGGFPVALDRSRCRMGSGVARIDAVLESPVCERL